MPKANGKPIPQVQINVSPSSQEVEDLLEILKMRFEDNKHRHKNASWEKIAAKLKEDKKKLATVFAMQETGGEPDVIELDGHLVFCDCSEQTPERRSVCYDQQAEKQRIKKGIKPGGSAIELAEKMGIQLLNEAQYRQLQELGDFDTKTSSWLETPNSIRDLGGAIFGDKRYNKVFVYHNGAESFYSGRGFRGMMKI